MDSPITETAAWRHEFKLTMATNFGDTSPSVGDHWYTAGSVVGISATAPSVISGERYVWLGWTGTGTISYTGMTETPSVTMDSPITETAAWRHEFKLTMATNFGDTSPSVGDHWYTAGTPVTIQATAPTAGAGEQYVWNGWTGSGSGSYTGTDNTASVTMNGPITETASWTHQYYLTVVSPYGTPGGMGWYNEGATAYATVTPLIVPGPTGVQYVFTHWSGDASGTASPSDPITMNAPKTATANWKTQYLVSFSQTGSAVAPTVDYTADTDPTGTVPFDVWVKAGSTITYTYQSVVPGAPGVQYVLTGVTPSSPQIVNGPLTITGNYKTQYQITVTASPAGAIGVTFNVTYTQCGTTYTNVKMTTTWTEWIDACTYVTLIAPLEHNVNYLFANWTVNAKEFPYFKNVIEVHMDGPKTATAVYKDYLGHAKEENAGLRAYVQNLYDTRKIGKKEYEHFMKDLDKVEKDIDKAINNFDKERRGYDDKMKGFEDLRHAVMKLKHMIKDVKDWAKKGKIPTSDATWIINELETIRMKLVNKAWAEALAERALALKAIENAKSKGKDTTKAEAEIAKVDRELAKAEQKIAEGKLSQAIQHFKHAFAHSHHAIKKAYDPTWTIDYKDWIDELEEEDP
jgi:hypothetical protein